MIDIFLYVSGVHDAICTNGQQREADRQINAALARLFNLGYRRMRIHSLPRSGDERRFRIVGVQ
jgi:hypothetical protein